MVSTLTYGDKSPSERTNSLANDMTDGEIDVRDVASSLINHTALATSEDLRWGMIWPVLVSPGAQMIAWLCNGGLGTA
jgi:hypothetical protein